MRIGLIIWAIFLVSTNGNSHILAHELNCQLAWRIPGRWRSCACRVRRSIVSAFSQMSRHVVMLRARWPSPSLPSCQLQSMATLLVCLLGQWNLFSEQVKTRLWTMPSPLTGAHSLHIWSGDKVTNYDVIYGMKIPLTCVFFLSIRICTFRVLPLWLCLSLLYFPLPMSFHCRSVVHRSLQWHWQLWAISEQSTNWKRLSRWNTSFVFLVAIIRFFANLWTSICSKITNWKIDWSRDGGKKSHLREHPSGSEVLATEILVNIYY